MYKVIEEMQLGDTKVLQLDRNILEKSYNKYRIEGKEYDIVPIFDAKQCIAIKASGNYLGKMVEVVLYEE